MADIVKEARIHGLNGTSQVITLYYATPQEMCRALSHRGLRCVLPKGHKNGLHATEAKHQAPQWK